VICFGGNCIRLISLQDHVVMSPTYKVDVITGSELANNPQYALQATLDYQNKLSGLLTNAGGDFFGKGLRSKLI
jgi:choline dehydrogenase